MSSAHWPLAMGAEWLPGQGVRFRVWAPQARSVEVELLPAEGPRYFVLASEAELGVFSATVDEARPGSRYKFRLDGGSSYPDPYSRSQPDGVHGASAVVDARAFEWHDAGWPGILADRLILYECHVGAYSPEGTFEALIGQLPALRDLGVTALELMPVAEFAGRRNWGYDGVDLFAPTVNYGGPIGLKRLVDAAHAAGLAVVLDVVYNHFGPAGNYLRAFSSHYFTDRYQTPWGEALNYDGQNSRWVRRLVVENACYWVREYRIDGLRLDATHAVFDSSPRHILAEIGEGARAAAGTDRGVVVIAEDGSNDVAKFRPVAKGGQGLDGVWADDFHHAFRTYLTGERDGYFADYNGTLRDVAQTIEEGFLYQGQPSQYLGRPRGTRTTDEKASCFVFCLQNHDQVGNRAFGDRLNHAIDLGRYLVASAVLLLVPETPLVFMGQEFAASAPFQYFTDHEPELGRLVTEGRRDEFRRFSAFADPSLRDRIPDPQAEATFLRSKLDLGERVANAGVYRCYRDLIRLRREDTVLGKADRKCIKVSVVGDEILVLHRWRGEEHRLLLANFGAARVLPLSPHAVSNDTPSPMTLVWSTAMAAYWEAPREQLELRSDGVVHLPAATAALVGVGPSFLHASGGTILT